MAAGRPSTKMLGIPSAMVAAAHLGLKPGALGLVGLPCMVTKEPTVATGSPLTRTVGAPKAITPGGNGNPSMLSGIPTVAIGTGILSYDSAFGYWLNTGGSLNVMTFNFVYHWTMHDYMSLVQRNISIYIRRKQALHESQTLCAGYYCAGSADHKCICCFFYQFGYALIAVDQLETHDATSIVTFLN
jgi:hypothetical protein